MWLAQAKRPTRSTKRPSGVTAQCSKACGYLTSVERETGLLSSDSRVQELRQLLPLLLHGLRHSGLCEVAIDSMHTISLYLPPPLTIFSPIEPHLVPVFISAVDVENARRWDLTLQKLLPHIDGQSSAARIAAIAHVDLPLVLQGLDALQAAGWISLTDIFAFSNTYACTSKIRSFSRTSALADQAVSAARGRGVAPTYATILRLLSAFCPAPHGCGWRSVLDVCIALPHEASKVDMRALVQITVNTHSNIQLSKSAMTMAPVAIIRALPLARSVVWDWGGISSETITWI